jgi:hypothetical protein
MLSWSHWIAFLSLEKLSNKNLTDNVAQPEKDGALHHEISLLRAENEALKQQDIARGLVHRRLKQRLFGLRKLHRQQRLAAREQIRTLRKAAWAWEHESKRLAEQSELQLASSTLSVMRPGLDPLQLPDPAVERRRKELVKCYQKVWQQPMRLGVFHQHLPKPLCREKFPKPRLPETEMPLISIITPSYQQGTYLERTLGSVLDQAYPRLDYRVMDGGSTDGSTAILAKYASKLAGWISEPDSGPAEAINKGFALSQGEIMGWLNSDDLSMPGVLHHIAEYFVKNPDVDVIYGHRVIINERDQQVGHWTLPRHDGETLLWADYVPQETLFWRRRIWDKAGARLDESFSFAFDWDLLLRFMKVGAHIVRLPYFLGCFRVHEQQKTSVEMQSCGMQEMVRLRERELGPAFNDRLLEYQVVHCQRKALRCENLRRLGIRW